MRGGIDRREWLRRALAASLGAAPARALEDPPRWRELPFTELSGFRTPTSSFFLRSHLNYPALQLEDWELSVEGRLRRPLRLRFADLQELASVSRAVTFECSGNPPGGGLVGTAEWHGVPLEALLRRAGVDPGAREVVLEGADAGLDEAEAVPVVYARSIPLGKALAPEPMIAWQMNGNPLRREHGFPVRAVVPGYYAMSHVKWLRRILVLDRPFKGFYMTKRYFTARRSAGGGFEIRPELEMKVKAQIARPEQGEQVAGGTTFVTGAAWTGAGTITRVEVSTDGGATWRAAELVDPPAPYAWVRWRFLWRPEHAGRHTLVCRAFDDRGGTQPEAPDPAVINRYGNNWYHRIDVTVQRA